MNVHDLELPVEPELEARLRRTLSQVAATIGEPVTPPVAPLVAPPAEVPAPADRSHARRRRRKATAIGVALAAVPLAAFGYINLGPEYVDQLPPRNVLQQGSADGHRYWLVPTFHTDVCGRPMPGVELVSERSNRIGAEWNTLGVAYGDTLPEVAEPGRSTSKTAPDGTGARTGQTQGCTGVDERAWLADPSVAALGGTRLGPQDDPGSDWVLVAAVHPRVRTLRVVTPGSPARTVSTVPRPDRPEGPRYAAATLPASATQAEVTLLDQQGTPVPAGTKSLDLNR